jgi:superfamily I DNA/RNA helicase
VRYIDSFLEDYPAAVIYALKRSYRCSDVIIRASRGMMGTGPAHSAALEGVGAGVRVRVVGQGSDRSEAEFVARTIERMIGGLRFFSMDSDIAVGDEGGADSLADFAVLCRIREQMAAIEEAFANHSIPYQAIGTTPFYREEPFTSLTACMKMARAQSGVSQQGKGRLPAGVQLPPLDQGVSVMEAAQRIAERCFGESMAEREVLYLRYLELCEGFGDDFALFFRRLGMGTGADLYRTEAEQVSLMTLHTAKGLEFSCVFIIGCEEGLIPYTLFGRGGGERDLLEERRLLYVGMTRARKYLLVSHAERRVLFGREFRLPRSRFLDTIEEELLERSGGEEKVGRRLPDRQLDLFADR